MAIWQYILKVIPKDDLEELGVVERLSFEDYNDYLFWRKADYNLSFFEPLTSVLQSNDSWSRDITLYGTEDSNCIEIFMAGDSVIELTIRLDFRTNYLSLLERSIEFCSLNALALLNESNDVLDLNATTIAYAIHDSPNYKRFKELQRD